MNDLPPEFNKKRFLIALLNISKQEGKEVDEDSLYEDTFSTLRGRNITRALPELLINRKKEPESEEPETLVIPGSYAVTWCEIAEKQGLITSKPHDEKMLKPGDRKTYGKVAYIFTEKGYKKAKKYYNQEKLDKMNPVFRFIYIHRSFFYNGLMLILTAIAAVYGLFTVFNESS